MIKQSIKKVLAMACTYAAQIQCAKTGDHLKVNFPCHFTKNTYIGHHCNFNGMIVTGSMGTLKIGNYFHSGKEIRIILDIHNYEGNKIPYDETVIKKSTIIDDFVWIGTRVTILGGVHIGEGAIIQAASTVVSDIPPYAIAGGHPAKVFKYRDIEHFKNLKEKGAFF